jgi:hypothetical protein
MIFILIKITFKTNDCCNIHVQKFQTLNHLILRICFYYIRKKYFIDHIEQTTHEEKIDMTEYIF